MAPFLTEFVPISWRLKYPVAITLSPCSQSTLCVWPENCLYCCLSGRNSDWFPLEYQICQDTQPEQRVETPSRDRRDKDTICKSHLVSLLLVKINYNRIPHLAQVRNTDACGVIGLTHQILGEDKKAVTNHVIYLNSYQEPAWKYSV